MTNPSFHALPANDFDLAKRQYLELYGSVAVMNSYLKVALFCLSLVCLGLMGLNVKTYALWHSTKPLIIRINEVGRAEAITYGSFDYHPQEAEIKFFLAHFVQSFYGRMRATIKESYPRSLYFLDGRLADAIIESNKKTKFIESFLTGQTDEIDIQIKNVAIEDLRQSPYKATVEFDKVVYAAADHAEIRRQRYVANFVFVSKMPVPNVLVPINPLGLTITYFREDQAFE